MQIVGATAAGPPNNRALPGPDQDVQRRENNALAFLKKRGTVVRLNGKRF